MKHLKLIVIVVLVFSGCSPKISEHFEENRYIRKYNIHIVNDSLQLYFKSPADIVYTDNKKELRKIIRRKRFKRKDNVLIYGKTDDPPYEYFVTLPENRQQYRYKGLITFDTIINGKIIRFTGNPLTENSKRALKTDLKTIFKSIEVGEGYRKEIHTVMDVVKKYQNSNKFFAALNEITGFPAYDKQEEWTRLQMELTFSSFLGNNDFYKKYLDQLESGFRQNDTISKIIKEKSETDSRAIEKIINEAKNHKIVMINENHFYPNHRILVSDLLLKLKEIGYNYLALEALDVKQDSLLNLENSYPTLKTGFYTREQNYANLIREAKDLDYTFVAYENTANKNRETGQAENLFNKTFKTDPEARVLVLAGIDHILEKPVKRGKKRMAAIFKNNYNIDPLTISQTHLNLYRHQTEANYSIIKSEWFTNDNLNAVDFLLLNNRKNNLPYTTSAFAYHNKEKQDVQIALFDVNELKNSYDYLKKVPYFTTILKKGKKYDLPSGNKEKVLLYSFDKNGKQVDKQVIMPVSTGDKK